MTVAAITAVLGGRKTLKRNVDYESELTLLTREGLPVSALTSMANELAIDRRTLARVVGISDRTLSRRIAKRERLSLEESDRTVRLARVVAMATDTLGTSQKASSWLQTANRALDGAVPLELMDTDTGVRSVETILGRIAWGVYS
jgi:putative toxin-antitoxin system antitoxin component (TIGR02293 family)